MGKKALKKIFGSKKLNSIINDTTVNITKLNKLINFL